MKLRSVHNSIRLRVRKSDVKRLGEEGHISESIEFPGGQAVSFSLSMDASATEVHALFEDNTIKVVLPENAARAWIASNEVGIEQNQPLQGEESLHILIEKDFPCVHRDQEEIHDYYGELSDKSPENC